MDLKLTSKGTLDRLLIHWVNFGLLDWNYSHEKFGITSVILKKCTLRSTSRTKKVTSYTVFLLFIGAQWTININNKQTVYGTDVYGTEVYGTSHWNLMSLAKIVCTTLHNLMALSDSRQSIYLRNWIFPSVSNWSRQVWCPGLAQGVKWASFPYSCQPFFLPTWKFNH